MFRRATVSASNLESGGKTKTSETTEEERRKNGKQPRGLRKDVDGVLGQRRADPGFRAKKGRVDMGSSGGTGLSEEGAAGSHSVVICNRSRFSLWTSPVRRSRPNRGR